MMNAGVVKLPPDFDLQGQNAASEWKFWRTAFTDYLVATSQEQAADAVKLSILRNIIGTESAKIMATFDIPQAQVGSYDHMLSCIKEYVSPRINESFERYNFLRRTQKEGENFEHFLTDCRHLIKTCNYNTNNPDESHEDRALRDKIVMGIKDPTTREALLRKDNLTLKKAVQLCRTSEQSKNQNLQFACRDTEVSVVTKKDSKFVSKHKNKNSNNGKS